MLSKLVLLVLLNVSVYASAIIIENEFIKTSVSDDGTFGNGSEFPGMQYDPSGKKKFNNNKDYLKPAIPFEYFSLKIGKDYFCSNNAFSASIGNKAKRSNYNNCKIIRSKIEQKSVSIALVQSTLVVNRKSDLLKLSLEQEYSVHEDYIKIVVKIKNNSKNKIDSILYARGLDPDSELSSGSNEAFNYRGYSFKKNKVSKKNVVFTLSKTESNPVGLYSIAKLQHNTSLLAPWDMDPKVIINGLEQKVDGNIHGDQTINIAFNLDSLEPNEEKSFIFYYIFGEDIAKLLEKMPKNDFSVKFDSSLKVPYKYTNKYEKVIEIKYSLSPENKKMTKSLVHFEVDDIPDGLMIQIGDNNLTSKNTTTLKPLIIYNDKKAKNMFKIYRNLHYDASKIKTISLKVKDVKKSKSTWRNDTIEIPIEPEDRNISIEIDSLVSSVPLDKLDESKEMKIELKHVGKTLGVPFSIPLSKEEFEEADLDIRVDGINYSLEKDMEKLEYRLKLNAEFPLCLTEVGNVEINLNISDGYYPNDYGSKVFTIKIVDVSWWAKCKDFIIRILIILFSIWYIVGLIKKNRFSDTIRLELYDYDMLTQEYISRGINYYLRQPRGLWILIPYIDEKETIDGLTFIAKPVKTSVKIDRESLVDASGKPLSSIKINGIKMTDSPPNKYGKDVNIGTKISIGDEKRYVLSNN